MTPDQIASLPVETRIDGYRAIIDTDDEQSTYCHVMRPRSTDCASLGLLLDLGGFEDEDYNFYPIPRKTVLAIQEWAEGTGLW